MANNVDGSFSGKFAGSNGDRVQSLRSAGLRDLEARDWPAAVAHFALYVTAAPEDAEGWRMAVLACREANWLEEAEALAVIAAERFPRSLGVLTEWALIALVMRRWELAKERWAAVHLIYPEDAHTLVRSATVAEELGDHAEAERFLDLATGLSSSGHVYAEHARFLERRARIADAVQRWKLAVDCLPGDAVVADNYCRTLNLAEMFDEAEEFATDYLSNYELTEGILTQRAKSAAGRLDWREAIARWRLVRDQFPGNGEAEELYGQALWHYQVSQGLNIAELDPHQQVLSEREQPVEVDEAKAVVLSFESLGDNCEFGLVQRHFGAEPIGMYRWGGVSVGSLIAAVEARFNGMGLVENTVLTGRPGDEYVLRDRRDWLSSHTFVPFNEKRFERIRDQQLAALQFLSDRLLQDIEDPWKVFVFKPRSGLISDDEMHALHGALEKIGAVSLLCVSVPEGAENIGTTQRLSRGLYRGNISRVSPTARARDIDYPGWLRLCKQTLELASDDGFKIGRS